MSLTEDVLNQNFYAHRGHHDTLHNRFNNMGATILNKSVGTSISASTVSAVPWESARVNDLGLTVSTPRIFLQVVESGMYLVTVNIPWQSNSTQSRSWHLQLNGTIPSLPSLTWTADGNILAGFTTNVSANENPRGLMWAGKLSANDKLSVWVFQSTAGALYVGGPDSSSAFNRPASTEANAEFSVMRML